MQDKAVQYIPKTIGHPGVPLASKLEEMEVSPEDFARQIGINEYIIVDMVIGKDEARITPELADVFHNVKA